MANRYAAFISYRHAALDLRVAAQIQRALEHFAVPHALQRTTGRKRLGRVFRDKEELPITSDLGATITAALAESEYLIVICSPRTRESQWVQREIETFLRTHTRNEVLTVLAEGEPQEIIPPILLHDDETGADLEPLSCDWRLPPRAARREELPRLAAALLGCAYDELRRRQRQYRLRRMAAAFAAVLAASLGFGGYMAYANLRIRQSYDAALRSQSRYLASEAQDSLSAGDRLTAVLLAMEALPGPGGDRPLVAEAEYALSRAVNAYTADAGGLGVTGSFRPEGRPLRLAVDADGGRLFIAEENGRLSAWDIAALTRLYSTRLPVTPDHMMYADGVLLLSENNLSAGVTVGCDPDTGAELWRREDTVLVAGEGMDDLWAIRETEERALLLVRLDAHTGAAEPCARLPVPEGAAIYISGGDGTAASPDGRYFLCRVYLYAAGAEDVRVQLFVYDTVTGAGQYRPAPQGAIVLAAAVGNGGQALVLAQAESGGGSEIYMDSTTTTRTAMTLYCLTEDGVAWQVPMDHYQVDHRDVVLACPDGYSALCVAANVAARVSLEDGTLLNYGEAPAPAVEAQQLADGSACLLFLQNGSICTMDYSADSLWSRPYLPDDVSGVLTVPGWGYFVRTRFGGDVLLYTADTCDDNGRAVTGGPCEHGAWSCLQGERYLARLDYTGGITLLDLEEARVCWSSRIFDDGMLNGLSNTTLLALDEQAGELLAGAYDSDRGCDVLCHFRLADGGREIEPMEAPEEFPPFMTAGDPGWCAGRVVRAANYYEHGGDGTLANAAMLTVYAPGTGMTRLPLWPDGAASRLFCGGGLAAVAAEDGSVCLADPAAGTTAMLEGGILPGTEFDSGAQVLTICDDGRRVAGAAEGGIFFWKADGTPDGGFALPDSQVAALCFDPAGDGVYVLDTTFHLSRFTGDGRLLGRMELPHYTNSAAYPNAVWRFLPDGGLALLADGVLTFVETGTMAARAAAADCSAYDAAHDQLLCEKDGAGGFELLLYRRYTLDDLLEMGRALAGGQTLSEAQRAAFGLD